MADQNQTKKPTCNAAKYSFPYTANGHSNISQKKFSKNLRQHMAERESNEQRGGRMIWEGLAAIQLLKHKAFNLTGSTPKLDILIRQLTLKGLHSSPVIYKEWSQYFWQDPFFLYALHGQRTERRQDGKKTINIHLRSNVLTLKKKKRNSWNWTSGISAL